MTSWEKINPPITAMPSGWRASPPAPYPIAIGTAPSSDRERQRESQAAANSAELVTIDQLQPT